MFEAATLGGAELIERFFGRGGLVSQVDESRENVVFEKMLPYKTAACWLLRDA